MKRFRRGGETHEAIIDLSEYADTDGVVDLAGHSIGFSKIITPRPVHLVGGGRLHRGQLVNTDAACTCKPTTERLPDIGKWFIGNHLVTHYWPCPHAR